MELFRGQNLIEFSKRIKTDKDCKEHLVKIKWKKGYDLNHFTLNCWLYSGLPQTRAKNPWC